MPGPHYRGTQLAFGVEASEGAVLGLGSWGTSEKSLHGEQQGPPREAVGLGSGSRWENHWGAPPQWQPGRAGSRWERKQEMEDRRREEKRADEAETKGERLRWAREVLGIREAQTATPHPLFLSLAEGLGPQKDVSYRQPCLVAKKIFPERHIKMK